MHRYGYTILLENHMGNKKMDCKEALQIFIRIAIMKKIEDKFFRALEPMHGVIHVPVLFIFESGVR